MLQVGASDLSDGAARATRVRFLHADIFGTMRLLAHHLPLLGGPYRSTEPGRVVFSALRHATYSGAYASGSGMWASNDARTSSSAVAWTLRSRYSRYRC